MKPLEALDSAIMFGLCPGGQYPHDGIKHYLRRGGEIPELMLPGGIIKRANSEIREALSKLTSEDLQRVAPWAIKPYL